VFLAWSDSKEMYIHVWFRSGFREHSVDMQKIKLVINWSNYINFNYDFLKNLRF